MAEVRLRVKIVTAAAAVVVAVFACELMARALFAAPPEPLREPQLLYQSHPEVGFLHVPNQRGYLDDGLASINALGLRGPLPASPKPGGVFRVLAIGDSMTFGWGVADDETFPAQLEMRLHASFPGRQIEVVNGGVGAYNLRQAARLLKHFAPALQPDLVIVGVFWNDLPYDSAPPEADALVVRTSRNTTGGEAEAAQGRRGPFRIGNNPSRLNQVLRQSRALYVARHAWLAAIAPTEAATNQVRWEMALLEGRRSGAIDEAWQDVAGTLAEIRGVAGEHAAAVGLVTLPVRAQVEGSYPAAEYQTRVRAIAEDLGVWVADPLPRFLAADDRAGLFIPYDRMHFTRRGNALVADAVFEVMKDRGVLQ